MPANAIEYIALPFASDKLSLEASINTPRTKSDHIFTFSMEKRDADLILFCLAIKR